MTVEVNPLLTAIVPVGRAQNDLKNLQMWVPRALEMGISVVLIEDIGKSGTPFLTDSHFILEESKFLTLMSAKCGSPGATRNIGLKMAKTEFIVFWDSDDIPELENTLLVATTMAKNNVNLTISRYTQKSEAGESVQSERFGNSRSKNIYTLSKSPGLWRCIFRTEFIKTHYFKNFLMGEDQVFLAEKLTKETDMNFSNLLVYTYNKNLPNSLTSSKKSISDIEQTITYLISQIRKNQDRDSNIFISIVLVRLIITSLKHIHSWTSLKLFFEALALMIQFPKYFSRVLKCFVLKEA